MKKENIIKEREKNKRAGITKLEDKDWPFWRSKLTAKQETGRDSHKQ